MRGFKNPPKQIVKDTEVKDGTQDQENEKVGNDERNFYLEREGGGVLEEFFSKDTDKPADRITALVEQGPIELFPYLLDPNFDISLSYKSLKWISFKVIRCDNNTIIGHILVHRFKDVLVKNRVNITEVFENQRWKGKLDKETIRSTAFQFILLGEKGELQYIKTQLELNSAKVPPSVLSVEVETI